LTFNAVFTHALVGAGLHGCSGMADIDLRAFGGLERDVKHLTERIEDLEKAIERLEARIAALTQLLDQARGARWVVAGVLALVSFVVGLAAAAKGLFR